MGVEELREVPPSQLPRGVVEFGQLHNLAHLKLDKCILTITATVKFGEDNLGLFVTTFGDEPSWRFGDEIYSREAVEKR